MVFVDQDAVVAEKTWKAAMCASNGGYTVNTGSAVGDQASFNL